MKLVSHMLIHFYLRSTTPTASAPLGGVTLSSTALTLLQKLKSVLPISTASDVKPSNAPEKPVEVKRHDFSTECLQTFDCEYSANIFSFLSSFDQAALNRILDTTRIQCPTCGQRFPKTDKSSFDEHIDWHFRFKARLEQVVHFHVDIAFYG